MPTRILYVMFFHVCEGPDCNKRKKTKKAIPDGWLKTRERHLFCTEKCLKAFEHEQSLISEVIAHSGEGVIITDQPAGRRSHQYPQVKNDDNSQR